MGIFSRNIEKRDTNGYTDTEFLRLLGIDFSDVSKEKLGEITYFTCVRHLSESLAKLPLKLYKDTKLGVEKATDHNLYQILKLRPNPYFSSWSFWATVEFYRNHLGNAFVYVDVLKSGKVKGLYILNNADVKVWVDNAGLISKDNAIWYIYKDKKGTEVKIHHNNILHFKTALTEDNGLMGLAVQDILKLSVENAQSGQTFINNYFKNGLFAKGLLQYTGDISDDKRKMMREKFESMANGIDNAGRILPVPLGFSFQSLNTNMTDAQFLELNKYTALQIASAFGIKPTTINNYDKGTFNNVESQQTEFYVDTLLSIITQYEQELTYKLLTQKERENGYFFKFNVDVILRADFQTRAEAYSKMVNNGLLTPNEVRAKEDLSQLPEGNRLIVNGNYIPLDRVGDQYTNGGGDNNNV